MNCQQCNCPNPPDARFCKNCGILLNYNLQASNPYLHANSLGLAPVVTETNEPSLKYFYILLSFDVFRSFVWLILNKVLNRLMRESSDFGTGFANIYDIYNISMNLILVVLIITCAVLAKNKSARLFIILYGAASLLLTLGFRFWN